MVGGAMSVTAAGDGSAEAILSSLYADALPSGLQIIRNARIKNVGQSE